MKKGIYLALATALISGFAVFFNSFAVKQLSDAFFFTTAKNLVVAFFIIAILIALKKWSTIKNLIKKDWLYLLLLGLIGGSIPFLLFFRGLSISTQAALNGAFIHKTLFIWVALLALIFLREKFSFWQYLALLVIFVGVYLMGGIKSWNFSIGEMLIFIATLMWSIEVVLVKKILRKIDFYTAAFGRMFFGSLIMIGYLLITNHYSSIFALNLRQVNLILISSVILLAYVISYYSAFQFTKATIVTSILTLAFPITVILQNFYKGIYSIRQLYSILIIVGGVILFLYLPHLIKKIKGKRLAFYGRN